MKDCKIRKFACLALCAMAAVASCAASAAGQMPGAEIRNRTWDRLSEKGMRNGLFELGDGYWNKSGGVLSSRNSV